MLSSSLKGKTKYKGYLNDSSQVNVHFPKQITEVKEEKQLYDLNKWDEEHLYPSKKIKSLQIEQRVSSFFETSSLDQLKFNNQIVNKMATIKEFQENKSILDLRKSIQQKASNIVAKNIKISNKHFDYDVFLRTASTNNSSETANATSTTFTRTHLHKELQSQEELHQVGKEIQLRKKVIMPNQNSKYIDSINENEEIKINNNALNENNLSIEGNFELIFSNDYYKAIVKNKKKSEKTFHQELNDIVTKLQSKHKQIADLRKEQVEYHKEKEIRRMRYLESKDAANIIEREFIKPSASTNQTNLKGSQWVRLKTLTNQLSLIEKEYSDIQEKTHRRLEEISQSISELKTEIASLNKYKEHNIKCLIDYYLDLLSKGIDVREVGLVWIIVHLTELGVHLTQNNFPDFIDYISIKYLIDYSKKAIQLKKLKQVMRFLKIKYKKQFAIHESATTNHFDDKTQALTAHHKTMILLGTKVYRIESNIPAHALIKYKQREKNELKMRKSQLIFGLENVDGVEANQKETSDGGLRIKHIESFIKEDVNKISTQSINDLTLLRNMIMSNENEMNAMKEKYLKYFKSKYEPIKLKGISECVRYDLMFSALFGNYAII